MMRNVLSIDLETYSDVNLKTCGVYRYVESPNFEVLLFAYAFQDGPIKVIDLAQGEKIPDVVMRSILNPDVIKTAFNAAFEMACLSKFFNRPMPPEQWECTAVHSLMLGLPNALIDVASVLKLEKQKMTAGGALIKYFCVPCKPTKKNGGRTRNLPHHDPEKWEVFKQYNAQDVATERDLRETLKTYPIPPSERILWQLDQKINRTGVRVDRKIIDNAIKCNQEYQNKLTEEALRLSNCNPKSVLQLKQWLFEEEGLEIHQLTKDTLPGILLEAENDAVKRVLEIRKEISKTSTKKYQAMERSVCKDGRIRGLLQFYGANRTGRWAGRLVQVQNLPKHYLPDLDTARGMLEYGDLDTLELLYDKPSNIISQLIRTAFIPSEGNRFIIADFSAIEARVIAWLAGERWRLDVFNTHGKIYEASAAQMFKAPIESIGKGNPLRQKGKVAELALGYQGGPGALIAMGALDMGLTEDELPELVSAWRAANRNIVNLWVAVEEAALRAIANRKPQQLQHGIMFSFESGGFFIKLPSGRRLTYIKPKLEKNKYNRLSITYEGTEQKSRKWSRLETYGGKLVENITQAIARDCLAVALKRLDKAGYNIVMHVHDEVILDMPVWLGDVKEVNKILGEPIEWARGLPLKADAYEANYYQKD